MISNKNLALTYNKLFSFNLLPLNEKRPLIPWEEWQYKNQSPADIESMPWEDASGIGIIMKDDLINIDIDKAENTDLLNKLLSCLGLPGDYPWVVQSGSGVGFHIYFSVKDKEKIYKHFGKTSSVFKLFTKEEGLCHHLELRLKECQNAFPPSLHSSGGMYVFLNNEPSELPLYVDEDLLLKSIIELCKTDELKSSVALQEPLPQKPYYDKDRLDDAINYLSAHLPAGSYDEWYKIGFSLVPLGGEGEKYFIQLSTGNKNYKDSEYEIRKKFNGLKKEYDGRITLGTLYNIAEQFGWKKPLMKFWWMDNKGTVRISRTRFKKFLESEGISKYKLESSYLFIRMQDNIVDEISPVEVKDLVMHYINAIPAESFEDISRAEISEALLKSSNQLFTPNFMEFLITRNLAFNRDSDSLGFFYFQNGFVEVSSGNIIFREYKDLKKAVWKKQVINRQYAPAAKRSDYEDFIYNVCSKSSDRYAALKSAIGYLLHSYKNPAVLKAIIFIDEKLSDGAFGQSGKGLICKSIAHVRNVVKIDGKNFNISSDFAFQRVSVDSHIIAIEDIREKFPFDRFFSIITDGITIEKKNQNQIYLNVNESPKLVITTNYSLRGIDDSSLNRQFVIEFSDHYNMRHTPIDDFGKLFFEGWNDDEWNAFDNYMIECLQYYLINGLVAYDYINLSKKKLIDETSSEFSEFAEELELNNSYDKKELFEKFKAEYSDYEKMTQAKFTKWLKIFGRIKNLQVIEQKSGSKRTILYSPLSLAA